MRVLTEQTAEEARKLISRAGLAERVGVHTLMGGVGADDWHLFPEREAVLVGTQDMLLSRALNRGYAASRARWPMDFGLLSQDALWVFDEVQLMDVGLATSAQLQAYRDDDHDKHLRPVHTWWMSATLQTDWLRSVDTANHHHRWTSSVTAVSPEELASDPYFATKSLAKTTVGAGDARSFASLIAEHHVPGTVTLVVCNTVDRAVAAYEALVAAGRSDQLELAHSRFRPCDRKPWRDRFLNRESCGAGIDRIIVATQVVEAGVDMSARTLITELAPWSSLVQRFGRCARYGGEGSIVVVDREHAEEKAALPYSSQDLSAAAEALDELGDAGIAAIERFEQILDGARRCRLYPYEPLHLLLRRELDDLFDTTPDLTGADLDISRFVRSGEERDCYVCWQSWPDGQTLPEEFWPPQEALCSVPAYRAEPWLDKQQESLRPHSFDYVDGRWRPLRKGQLRAGLVIVVDTRGGGYDTRLGFTGKAPSKKDGPVPLVPERQPSIDERADRAQDAEDLSERAYQSIAAHGLEVGTAARSLAERCAPQFATLLHLAGRLHDWGKVHPAFQGSIMDKGPENRSDLAKAPSDAWRRGARLYPMPDGEPRRAGFRHELVSALSVYELLARRDQRHPALLGELGEAVACGGLAVEHAGQQLDGGLIDEIFEFDGASVDLLCYLIASHHGKLRVSWHPCPQDQDYPVRDDRGLPLRGVRDGDELPAVVLCTREGNPVTAPALTLRLSLANLGLNGRYGRSWRERTLALQEAYGPSALAYLEALLRAADIRVSRGERDAGATGEDAP